MASRSQTLPPSFEVADSEDERWRLVSRVTASAPFSRAPHLRGFLLFVTSRFLAGRESEINEYVIGCAVLGRRPSFNPHEDNIVRVQARHLRAKLQHYFENEGREEPLVITIPRGSYVPAFEPRPLAVEPVIAALPEPAPPEQPAAVPPQPRLPRRIVLLALVSAAAILIAVAVWAKRPGAPAPPAGNPLLAAVFQSGDSTKVVISDSGAVMIQETLRRRIPLDQYVSRNFAQLIAGPPDQNEVDRILTRNANATFTNYSDMNAAMGLQQLAGRYQTKTVVRHPHHLNVRDFESSSFILLGGPLANPWYQLFENQMNFVFDMNLESGLVRIRNKAPQAGEQALYVPRSGAVRSDYGIVAIFPNLRNSGHVLMLAGAGVQGTEAASNLIIREQLPANLAAIVSRMKAGGAMEVLFETPVLADVPGNSQVIAYRTHQL